MKQKREIISFVEENKNQSSGTKYGVSEMSIRRWRKLRTAVPVITTYFALLFSQIQCDSYASCEWNFWNSVFKSRVRFLCAEKRYYFQERFCYNNHDGQMHKWYVGSNCFVFIVVTIFSNGYRHVKSTLKSKNSIFEKYNKNQNYSVDKFRWK